MEGAAPVALDGFPIAACTQAHWGGRWPPLALDNGSPRRIRQSDPPMPRVWRGLSQESATSVLLNTMLESKAAERYPYTPQTTIQSTPAQALDADAMTHFLSRDV